MTLHKWLNYWLVHIILILAGFIVMEFEHPYASAIGGSVCATGLAGMVLFLFVRFHGDEITKQEHLRSFGFEDAFETRSVGIRAEYDRLLGKAQTHIDIMGFGLNHLREDYRGQFATWATRAQVRILLIHPHHPNKSTTYASQRAIEENADKQEIEKHVRRFLKDTESLRKTHSKTFQIRLYTCLPSVNIFRVDGRAFWGPYLIQEPSRSSPTFLMRQGGPGFDHLTRHFERIWTSEAYSCPCDDWDYQ